MFAKHPFIATPHTGNITTYLGTYVRTHEARAGYLFELEMMS